MTPDQMASLLERRASAIEAAAVRGVERGMEEVVLPAAVRQSSGMTSSAQLRRAGHPYARRHGSPSAPLLPINRQSGRFASAWQKGPVTVEGDAVRGSIANTSPEAGWLKGGNRFTFARPLEEAVIEETREAVAVVVSEEIARAMKG